MNLRREDYEKLDWGKSLLELAIEMGRDPSTLAYWKKELNIPHTRRGPKLKQPPGRLESSIRKTSIRYGVSWITAKRWHVELKGGRSSDARHNSDTRRKGASG